MKKSIIAIGAIALSWLGNYAIAEDTGTGHTVEVTPGDWDDDDPKLNFNFQDIPLAEFIDLRLHLTCGLPEAKILYTTEESADPADSNDWTTYTEPLYLTEDCTVRFFARCEGYYDSDIQTYVFVYADHQVATPELTADSDNNLVTISCVTEGAEIHYTTDGSEPTEDSELYTGPIEITETVTIRARAFSNSMFASEISEITATYSNSVATISIDSMKVCKEGGDVVVYSDNAIALPIYTVDSRLVKTIQVEPGRNVIDTLDSNVYIIGTTKIKL